MVTAILFPNIPVEILDVQQGQPLVKTLNGQPMNQVYVGGQGYTLVDWRYVSRDEITAICKGDITETDEYQNWAAACADVDNFADETRPETAAALALEEFALKQLIEMMEEKQETK